MANLNPYLSFKNQAREAMEFYRGVFGGELTVSTFADYPGMSDDSEKDLVMHAQLETPDGFVLMGSDTPDRMQYEKPAPPWGGKFGMLTDRYGIDWMLAANAMQS
jgi:PhnB protein